PPRVLEHRRPYRAGQVEAHALRGMLVQPGQDSVGLRIAFKALAQTKPVTRQAVQCTLAQVTKWWVTNVVRAGRGLHHLRVTAAEVAHYLSRGAGVAPQVHGDSASHGRDPHRVDEPVVNRQSGPRLRD